METADLEAYARDRDPVVRERLVRAYLPLAHAIAGRFNRGGRVPLDDLQQVAALGLIKALDRFDVGLGTAFSSFAVPTIQGEIRRYFRDFTWNVRPPRELQERTIRVERAREHLTSELGRNPTAAELAENVGCSVEEILDASEAAHARTGDSLQRSLGPHDADGENELGASLGTDEGGFAQAEARATLDHMLAGLCERERLVLELRFHEDLTQSEIGRRVGCSQMHVSRILRRALAKLSEAAADAD